MKNLLALNWTVPLGDSNGQLRAAHSQNPFFKPFGSGELLSRAQDDQANCCKDFHHPSSFAPQSSWWGASDASASDDGLAFVGGWLICGLMILKIQTPSY